MITEKKWLGLVIIIVINVSRWFLFDNIILLSQSQTNDSFPDAIFTIFLAFTMIMSTFLKIKEGEPGDGESAQQQQAPAQSQTTATALVGASISLKKGYEKNKKINYGAFDHFLKAIFTTINFSILMTFLSIAIIGSAREFDTIVAVACGIFTLLPIVWCSGGNNSKTDGGGTFAYEFDEMDRSARRGAPDVQQPAGNKKAATIAIAIFKDELNEINEYNVYCKCIDETNENKIKKHVNYLQWIIIDTLFDKLIEFLSVLFTISMTSLNLLLIETFYLQDSQLFNLERTAGDGQQGGGGQAQKQQFQPPTTVIASERNKKLNRGALDTFLGIIIGTIDFNVLVVFPLFVFGINSRCIDNCSGGGNDVTRKKVAVLGGLNETSDPTRHDILLTSNETKEKNITKYVNYSQWIIIDCISFYNNGLFDAFLQILFVLFVLILFILLLAMELLQLLLIETFNIVEDGDIYNYYHCYN